MEPGLRWLRCEPCDDETPLKLWRFMTPAKPLPFEVGALVDVTGTTKGKGFAGVMKRHGFKGVSSSHGSHRNHRKPGSIGGASTPGRVFKGMRMAGRMGGERQTTQNLTIHAVDVERGLLLIKGAVPGPRGGIVLVRTAAKGA